MNNEELMAQLAELKNLVLKSNLDQNKLLTPEDASEILQVSKRTLFTYRQQGLKFKKFGRSVRFLLSDLMEFVNLQAA